MKKTIICCTFILVCCAAALTDSPSETTKQLPVDAVDKPAPKAASKPIAPKKQLTDYELGQRLVINTRGNSWSQKLLSMSERDRAYTLANVAECTTTGRAMFTGSSDGTDLWSVGCSEGDMQVSISQEGSSRLLECSFLPRINLECWRMLDSITKPK